MQGFRSGILLVSTETIMKTKIQKWGNSLALRIPRPFAEEVHIQENSTVDVSVRSGKLVVVSAEPVISLESLIEQITDENRHGEIETGRPVGNEIW
jgi:antitoxin MazE